MYPPKMAPFPAWMDSDPYTSSSGSATSSSSKSSMKIYIDHSGTTTLYSILRRRSPHSSFGHFTEINAQNTYHLSPDGERLTHEANSKSKSTSPMAAFSKFCKREWWCISRGRLLRSRLAAFSSAPLLIFTSFALLDSFLGSTDRRRSETQRATEKEREDWGNGFH